MTDFSIFLGDKLLVHRRDFDIEVVLSEKEVRSEEFGGCTVRVPFDGEFRRFVFPIDRVEIEQSSKLELALMGEINEICRRRNGIVFASQVA